MAGWCRSLQIIGLRYSARCLHSVSMATRWTWRNANMQGERKASCRSARVGGTHSRQDGCGCDAIQQRLVGRIALISRMIQRRVPPIGNVGVGSDGRGPGPEPSGGRRAQIGADAVAVAGEDGRIASSGRRGRSGRRGFHGDGRGGAGCRRRRRRRRTGQTGIPE